MPKSYSYQILSGLFVTTLLVSNIIATKIGDFGGYFLPVAVILFPVSYILGDVLTEVYGYAATRRIIWLGFFCNLVAVLTIWLALKIPAAPFFDGQAAYERILGPSARILGASFLAYLVGEFANSFVLAKLKIKTAGRFLWLRTISSTLVGQALDSSIFITLAFWGIFPPAQIGTMILLQWLFKTSFEALATPITYLVVGILKKRDQVDAYDRETNFNPFALS